MNEEDAIRVIKEIRNSSVVITVLYFIFFVIVPIKSFGTDIFVCDVIPMIVMLVIFNGLAFGVYRYRSRGCAIVLFLLFIYFLKLFFKKNQITH
ncbi:MAG TPA: hypothetical protein DG753_01820 [Clostridium sp.]|nr:hypothetical protein [Clostridium sp.]